MFIKPEHTLLQNRRSMRQRPRKSTANRHLIPQTHPMRIYLRQLTASGSSAALPVAPHGVSPGPVGTWSSGRDQGASGCPKLAGLACKMAYSYARATPDRPSAATAAVPRAGIQCRAAVDYSHEPPVLNDSFSHTINVGNDSVQAARVPPPIRMFINSRTFVY